MKRALVVLSASLVFVCGTALAQDTPQKIKPKAAARIQVSQPQLQVPQVRAPQLRADPLADAADSFADIADKEAICMREAARVVHGSALKLRSLNDPAQVAKQREELDFALGVLDECHNIARKREAQHAKEERAPEPAAADNSGLFSFGSIEVEQGSVDPSVVARALRSQSSKLVRCYDTPRNEAGGAMKLMVRLAPRGGGASPSAVQMNGSSVDNPAVHRCVARTLMNTSFPAEAAGSEVSLELGFAPSAR